nr:LamG-like jellyroll fold domain-containing protein [Streptomyces roseirectus]
MRPARPLVIAVAFVMAVLAGTEGVASAQTFTAPRPESVEAPEQRWGSADGHPSTATAGETSANASGGRRGHTAAPGELPPESGVSSVVGAANAPVPDAETAPVTVRTAEPKGFDAATSREVVGERERTSRTFENTDGTLTTRFYDEPVNFQNAAGNWTPIDTTLKPAAQSHGHLGQAVSAAEDGWKITAGDAETTFAGHADGAPLVSLRTGTDTSVGFSIQDAAHAPGEADASTVVYRSVRPSADVRFVAGGTSVKEVITLDSADAPTEWIFPLHTQGVTARLEATGAVTFRDAAGGVRATMPAGWMEDANLAPDSNQGEISTGVRYELLDVTGGQALKVSLDTEWLNAPQRVFPVKVDPTVTTVTSTNATSGTYVQSPYNADFSGDTNVKIGTYDGGGHKAAAFLRFAGVENTLKNAWVVGARLAVYNTWSYSCTARPVTVHAITSNWAESTTRTYPGPSTGSALSSKSFTHGWRPEGQTAYPCGAAAWESIPLGSAGRQLVDDWTHGRKKNYGLALKASTTDSKAWKNFGSDDYPNGKPSLDVTWTKYGATYKLGEFVTPMTATSEGVFKVTVTNRGQQTWPKGGNFTLRYLLYDAAGKEITDTSKIRWSTMPADVPPGATVTVDAKIAPLTPADYTLAWTMNDNGVATFSGAGVPVSAMRVSAVNVPPYLTGAAPASGAVVSTLTPTLWASGADRDRYPKALQYQFEVCEVEGKNTRKNCKTGPRVSSQQWAVTSGWLSWSKTYAWYGYAYDGSSTSTRPGPSLLTTQVPQPVITSHLGGSDSGRIFGERSGNYATSATDAAVPTVGPELSVTRTYNSQDPRQRNAFGAGWATRWDMRAEAESTGSVVLTLATGTQVRFGKNADGTYAAPSGSAGVLKAQSGGGWTLRDGSGTLSTFSSAGLLTKIADGHGRAQELTYTDGKLTQAKDVLSGRTLTFTWSGGHVTAAETNAVNGTGTGLKWAYTYDGDRLTKVCPPSSTTECTVYTYESGSLYRSTVLDDGPTGYWRLNEPEEESAASEAVSNTGLNDALYRDVTRGATGALSGTGNKAGSFDGADSHLALPDDALGSSPFASVELWFQTTKPGVLLSQANERMEDVDPSVSQSTPLLYVGTDGKLRGQFYFPGTTWTPLTSTGAVNDGSWHHVVLSGAGTTQTLYLDGVAVGSKTGVIDHLEQRYTYVGLGWTSVPWAGIDKTDQLGHFTGSIDEVAVYGHTMDASTAAAHYAARTAVSRITKVILPSGRVSSEVSYDSDTERVTQAKDNNGGVWKVSAPAYSAGSAAYSDAVRASGPNEYWRLGDRRGTTAATALPEGSDGTYGDNAALGTYGAFAAGDDTAVGLSGDSYVQLADASLSGAALSAELWFRTDKPGILLTESNTDISEDEVPSRATPLLYVGTDGKLRGQFYSDTTNWTPPASKSTVTDSQWHHAVVTGNGSTSALYVDGALAGTVSGAITHLDQTRIFLGKGRTGSRWAALDSTDPWGHFSGALDEVAFYPKALTAAEIGAHYRSRTGMVTGDGPHYRGAVTVDAPAGYWRLDESTGTTAHSQVAVLDGDGTYTNATLGADGAFGTGDNTAVTFKGNGYAEIPGSILRGSTDLAVELWFKTTKAGVLIGDQSAPMGATVTGTYAPLLYVGTDGKLNGKFFSSGLGTAKVASADSVTDDQWHHAVVTATGTAQTLYLDGVQAATLTGAVNHQSNTRTYIGAGFAKNWPAAPADASYFTGQIDEVAVYQHGLSADQVAEHYRSREHSGSSALAMTVTVTDPVGATTSTTYDALRGQRRTATTDADGGVTTYAYDTGGYLHTVTDPAGHSTVTGHDARGNTVSTTTCRDAGSCATSFTTYFLNAGDPLDPRNDKALTQRDARSTGPADNRYRTTFAYNTLGLPTAATRADNTAATTTYTAGTEAAVGGGTAPAGLALTQTTPGGAKTSYRYYASGDLADVTSPSGLVTSYTYDGLGRKTAEKQVSDSFPAGVTTAYGYDQASRIVSETGTGVKNEITNTVHTAAITRTYDADGNLLTETTKDTTGGDAERTTVNHYDEHGLNDSSTDAEQNTTTYEHDLLGRVTSQTDPAGTRQTYTYTARGQHATTVLNDWTGDPSGTTRDLTVAANAYDPSGRLASTTDAMGATTAYTYYDDGLPATTTARQVTQADGTRHDIVTQADTYDLAGHLTRRTTGNGTTTQTFTVDALGRTTASVLDPGGLGRATTYTYDSDDRVTETAQSIAGTGKLITTSAYDAAGNVTRQTATDGTTTHTVTTTYDRRGLPLTTVSPRGNTTGADPAAHTTTYRYDALGRLVQQTAPAVQTEENNAAPTTLNPATLTGYNTFGEATEAKDPRGNITRVQLDRLGRTTTVTLPDYTPPGATAPLTATSRTSYTPTGLPQTTTDPLGRVTRYAYDQLGQLLTRTDPAADATAALAAETNSALLNPTSTDGGGITRYTWTPTGLQLSATDPLGARTESTYDELGRTLTATTVERRPTTANLVSRYTWDDADNQTASTTPAGVTTTSTYNPAGEAKTVTTPAGTTKFDYDGLGRRTQTTDATNRRTTTTYGALGNATATTDYGTGTTALRTVNAEYDAEGNLTAAVSPQTRARTTYTYDALGRTTQQTEPLSATTSITTSFGYDAAGNRTRLTDGRGNTTTYTFTPWGLPESTIEPSTQAHPATSDRTWTTVYDKTGQAVKELLPGGVQREKTYDALGRLTRETGTGAEAATTTRTLEYDLAGHLTATGTADALTRNTYTYNDRGQLLTAAGPGGTSEYSYNADGAMTMRKTGAGTTSYGYDTAGRIDWTADGITDNQIWYDFDAAGRPKQEQYATKPAGATAYTATARRAYAYDELGRLNTDTLTTVDGTTTVASTAYDYDLDDNLTSKKTTGTAGAGTNTYAYDQADRMTSWTKDGTTTAYTWDASGNRTQAGTRTATFDARNRRLTDGTTTFTYTARGTLASTTNGTGTPRTLTSDAFERKITDGATTYTYDSLDRIQTRGTTTFTYDGGSNNLATDGTTTYNRTPDGALLSYSTGTTKQWALTDQHTDLVAGLTPDATQTTSSTTYDPFGTKTTTTGTTPALGYQSGWTDPTTGDINMAARWYQPGTGSFGSRDTWQLEPNPSSRANRYLYGGGNPLLRTDPTGHDWSLRDALHVAETLIRPSPIGVFFTVYMGGSDSIGDECYGMPCYLLYTTTSSKSQFCDTHSWTVQCGGAPVSRGGSGSRGSGYHGGGSSYRGGGSPYKDKQCSGSCTVQPTKPPKPPIDQNPNDGPNPRTAPDRPIALPEWGSGLAGWTVAQGVDLVVSGARVLGLLAAKLFDPEDLIDLLPVPKDEPGGKNKGRQRQDEKCDDGPGVSPTGHAVYLPRERYYDTFEKRWECRATGVYGLLDQSDYNKGRKAPGTNTNDSTQPPGMREIVSQGHRAANGHLIPAAATGSGIDLRNLVAEYEKTNTPYLNHGVEKEIRNAIKSGKHLAISVTPHYGNSGSGIPTEIEYNYGTVEDGTMKHCVISQSPAGGTTRGSKDCPRR